MIYPTPRDLGPDDDDDDDWLRRWRIVPLVYPYGIAIVALLFVIALAVGASRG